MARSIATKLLLLLPVVFLVSVATFMMTELLPGDPAVAILGENAARLYGFDLAKLEPLAARVGPTPEEIEVPLAPEEIPRDSASAAFL